MNWSEYLAVASIFRNEVEAALRPGRWRGFNGPDGVTNHEMIQDVGRALDKFDKAIKELNQR